MLTILKEQALKVANTLYDIGKKVVAQPVETAMVLCNKIVAVSIASWAILLSIKFGLWMVMHALASFAN
tara:strand:+ start:493 stop:699 length:207 start_codon:yes stop_codon:yes gene_type:complete